MLEQPHNRYLSICLDFEENVNESGLQTLKGFAVSGVLDTVSQEAFWSWTCSGCVCVGGVPTPGNPKISCPTWSFILPHQVGRGENAGPCNAA